LLVNSIYKTLSTASLPPSKEGCVDHFRYDEKLISAQMKIREFQNWNFRICRNRYFS